MLAVSPLRSTTRDEGEGEGEMESFFMGGNEFPDFSSSGNLLESIDFDDLFVGIEDGDLLPDLEMDSEMFSEFSSSGGEELEGGNSGKLEEGEKVSGLEFGPGCGKGEEIASKREESVFANPSEKVGDKARKSSAHSKNPKGKRKVKVDWTPELHRRFVQAVEQLGVDKAVPSRILELMGIGCLTRHNIASHLQKYRSHRKHLLAREAEAANWSHRRQIYGGSGGGGGSKISMSPWLAPTIGFPPASPAAMTPLQPHFRPLHVWGHPSAEQPLMHLWPKHQVRPLPPPPPPAAAAWAPTPLPSPARPPPDPSFWHPHHHRVPNPPHTPGTPYFPPPPLPTTRFPAPPPVLVPGIPPPPHAMYRSVVDPAAAAAAGAPIGVPTRQTGPHPPLVDFHLTTKESIDSAIGDVLSKPWLPLPLGLKPPSHDSVLVELQRQGVPKIPPASCA